MVLQAFVREGRRSGEALAWLEAPEGELPAAWGSASAFPQCVVRGQRSPDAPLAP